MRGGGAGKNVSDWECSIHHPAQVRGRGRNGGARGEGGKENGPGWTKRSRRACKGAQIMWLDTVKVDVWEG